MSQVQPPKERHLRLSAPASASGKTIGLWVVLIVLFVAFYNFFRSASPDGEASAPSDSGSGFSAWSLVNWLFWPVVIAFFAVLLRQGMRWWRINEKGRAYLSYGDFESAIQVFDGVARKAKGAVRAEAVVHLGLVALRRGELERALSLFTQAESSQLLAQHPGLSPTLPGLLSFCESLLGDLAAARKWLEVAHARGAQVASGYSLLAEVALLCREGHLAAAAKIVDTRWREAERSSVWETKVLRLLKAFALDGLEAAEHETARYEALAGLRPFRRGELDLLAADWPKLRDFMTGEGLTGSATAVA
jgi:tetratricopeptide (TPR) repeat protein